MTLTERGAAVLAAGLAASGVGLAMGSPAAAGLGLTLLLGVALASRPRRPPGVRVERRLDQEMLREGMAVGVSTTVRCEGRLPARLELVDTLPAGFVSEAGTRDMALGGAGERTHTVLARPRVPGRFTWPPAVVRWRDAAGLSAEVLEVAAPAMLRVYPRVAELRETVASSQLIRVLQGLHRVRQGGPGTEFYALREFQEGDPLRSVNWRASARAGNGKLLVNQRERESHARLTVLADGRAAAGVGTRSCHAWAQTLRGIAVLATAAFRARDATRVVVYGEGVADPVHSRAGDAAQFALLDALMGHQPRGRATAEQAVDAVLPLLRSKEPVVVISNLLGDATFASAVARLRAFDCPVVVLAVDGPALLALSGAPAEQVRAAAEAHRAALAAVRARGAVVIPWDPREELPMALAKAVGP